MHQMGMHISHPSRNENRGGTGRSSAQGTLRMEVLAWVAHDGDDALRPS